MLAKEKEDIANTAALDLIFTKARTYNSWQDQDVSDDILQEAYNLARMGPTSANCSPLRIVFVKSPTEKQRLKPALAEGNQDKSMQAPVIALFAHDMAFYEELPFLFPHTDARSWFAGKDDAIQETAFRNGTLQAAYFMIAARALGLDCGPMSGFDADKVNEIFFPDGKYKVNFLCNIGYGSEEGLHPRAPRFEFDQVCSIR